LDTNIEEKTPLDDSHISAPLLERIKSFCKRRKGMSPWGFLINRLAIDVLLLYPFYRFYNRMIIMPLAAVLNIYKYLPEFKDKPAIMKQVIPEPVVYDHWAPRVQELSFEEKLDQLKDLFASAILQTGNDPKNMEQVRQMFQNIVQVGQVLVNEGDTLTASDRMKMMDKVLQNARTLTSDSTYAQKKEAVKRISKLERTVSKKYLSPKTPHTDSK